MTTRPKMQFFQRLVKCELSALRNDPCDGIVHVNVKGPENADYFFCKRHGERFVAKMRAWEADEAERESRERERMDAEAEASSMGPRIPDCRDPEPPLSSPRPAQPDDSLWDRTFPRPRRARIYARRNKTVDEGGDAHGMCSVCDADHFGAFDVTIIRADGEPVAILSLCEARMRDLAQAIMQALEETAT